jgi:hypothetical protein
LLSKTPLMTLTCTSGIILSFNFAPNVGIGIEYPIRRLRNACGHFAAIGPLAASVLQGGLQ